MDIKKNTGSIKLEDIIRYVSKTKKIYKNQIEDILKCTFDYIIEKQKEGCDINLQGYMKLYYKPHKARYGHNLKTGKMGMSKNYYTLQYSPCIEVLKILKNFEMNESDLEKLNK